MFKFIRKISLLLIPIILIGVLAGCSNNRDDNSEIVLLEGQFSEINIIIQMAAILIEENTDLQVKFHDSMNTVAAANANERKEVDLYVSYDGTLLTTILGHDPSDVPEEESLFEFAKELGSEEKDLH